MIEEINILDYPDLLDEIRKEVAEFTVGFAKLEKEDAQLAGSGTLIEAEGFFGILTAHHVIEEFPSRGEIGLILPTRFESQLLGSFSVNMNSSRKIAVARGKTDSEGPDLGLLILSPEKDVGTIKAKKTFYNLSKRRDMILSSPPPIEMGAWGLSGIAHEWTEDAPPERGFKRVKIFRGMCGF